MIWFSHVKGQWVRVYPLLTYVYYQTVFMVFSLGILGDEITYKYPCVKKGLFIGISHDGGPRWTRGTPPTIPWVCRVAWKWCHLGVVVHVCDQNPCLVCTGGCIYPVMKGVQQSNIRIPVNQTGIIKCQKRFEHCAHVCNLHVFFLVIRLQPTSISTMSTVHHLLPPTLQDRSQEFGHLESFQQNMVFSDVQNMYTP